MNAERLQEAPAPAPAATRLAGGGGQKLPALTGLRFLAAAMIVVHHSRGVFGLPKDFLGGVSLHCGVSFFFVLSGFILAHVYPSLEGPRAKRRFWIARFARIWPAHLFTFLLVLALALPAANGSAGAALTLAHVAMVHAWVPLTAWFFSYNAVSWSISTEFFFYAAFPFLLLGFGRNWWWKLLLGGLVVAALVFICVRVPIAKMDAAGPLEINRAGLLYISPLARIAEFILGMVAARFWSRHAAGRITAPGRATALEAGCVGLCVWAIVFLSAKGSLQQTFGDAWAAWLRHAGAAPVFALLILVFASQRGWLSAFFATPALVLLGEISFSIYLLHQIFLRWITAHRATVMGLGLGEPAVYALFCAVLIGAAWAVWRGVERPGRRFLLKLQSFV